MSFCPMLRRAKSFFPIFCKDDGFQNDFALHSIWDKKTSGIFLLRLLKTAGPQLLPFSGYSVCTDPSLILARTLVITERNHIMTSLRACYHSCIYIYNRSNVNMFIKSTQLFEYQRKKIIFCLFINNFHSFYVINISAKSKHGSFINQQDIHYKQRLRLSMD